jgi:glycosyltransferase involved in cell wall biosynthesis
VKITVAMCTFNPNSNNLRRALDAIVSQLSDVPSAEVIVVDNNSTPPLAERHDLDDYPIRLIPESKPGLTAARETVFSNAQGDVIVFVDDDNVLGPNYLATVLEAFSNDPKLGLLGGCILPEYETVPPSWFGEFEPWLAVRHYAPEFCVETAQLAMAEPPYTKYFPVGAGFATRRDLALAYRQDCVDTMRIEGRRGSALSSGEDIDLGFFVLSRGYKLVVTGALSMTHVIPAGRLKPEYLRRLAVAHIMSSRELERKWSTRAGHTVYPMFSMSLAELLARTAATAVLSLGSPRYKIKRALYLTLVRVRFSGT